MTNFLAELKRRNIYRVAAAYAVVAWVLIQLVSNVSPMLRLPDWAGTLVLVLLFVGFPVALLFAWIHQLAPERGALAPVTTGKLDWVLIGALAVVAALMSYQQLAPSRLVASQQASVAAARDAAASPRGAISIAVLPFANLSGDASQEFFSDGITEEITSALAKVPDLRVVARTSAYQFKSQNRDIQDIGRQLPFAPFIIRWGPNVSSDVLRKNLKCSRCGHRGNGIQPYPWRTQSQFFRLRTSPKYLRPR